MLLLALLAVWWRGGVSASCEGRGMTHLGHLGYYLLVLMLVVVLLMLVLGEQTAPAAVGAV